MTDRADDRAAIAEVMYRYTRATDWNRPENHRDVFVDDCVFASPHSQDIHGVDAVVRWMHDVLPQFDHTQHLVGNISIDFTGPDTADAVSYVQAWHRFVDRDRPDMILHGEYHDQWVRTDRGWRIAVRRVLEAGWTPLREAGAPNPRTPGSAR